MRFTKNITGIERTKTKVSKKPRINKYGYGVSQFGKKNESQDTKNRKDIYIKLVYMINQGENPIKIECVLREEYPDYAMFIAQLVNDQFSKHKQKNNLNTKVNYKNGDER